MDDLATFMREHPHNTDCSDKFALLLLIAYRMDKEGLSLEEFVESCLGSYGGTVAEAMIEYIYNHI